MNNLPLTIQSFSETTQGISILSRIFDPCHRIFQAQVGQGTLAAPKKSDERMVWGGDGSLSIYPSILPECHRVGKSSNSLEDFRIQQTIFDDHRESHGTGKIDKHEV